jgi:predicted nucleic acid-binding protein
MILYLDTSSLVKLYVEEEHTSSVRAWAHEADVLATSRVALPEAMAALARRWRESALDDAAFERVRTALSTDWDSFVIVDTDERLAGDLAVRHSLRGFDAIHLAAALVLDQGTHEVAIGFASFDERQRQSAQAEGLMVLGPPPG